MILIVGALGNMGSRYAAILNYLGVTWEGVDLDSSVTTVEALAKKSHGILIASPTDVHYEQLGFFSKFKKPIFCEKPFTKNMNEMDEIVEIYDRQPLTMALQYSELIDKDKTGDSRYDYFRHGQDGLIWDCIQIIGLAKGSVSIEQQSPIWNCTINGQQLSIGDMDSAYIKNIKRWLSGESMELKHIYEIHQKTSGYQLDYKSLNRHPGAKHVS